MKNVEADPEDTLRPEYKRSDFSEVIRGKYATIQVDFHQLTGVLLTCVGEDEDVRFMHYSPGNRHANHKRGDWTYEIDNGNRITLRYWLNEFRSIEEALSNPTVVMTPKERTDLQQALFKGVTDLRAKVAARAERQ